MRNKDRKIRKMAQGEMCQVRIPHVCNHNPETTVLAHLNGSGAGTKFGNNDVAEDILGAWCCSDCHDAIDGRNMDYMSKHGHSLLEINHWFYEGVFRTQRELIKRGVIKV